MLKKNLKQIRCKYEKHVATKKPTNIYISLSAKEVDMERVKVRRININGDNGWMVEDSLGVGGFFRQERYELFDDALTNAIKKHNNKSLCISFKTINPHYQEKVYTS